MHVPLMSDAHSVQTSVGCVHRNGENLTGSIHLRRSFVIKQICSVCLFDTGVSGVFTELTWWYSLLHRAYRKAQSTWWSNKSLLDDTAEASGLSHMPIEYDSYVPGSAHVCSQEFMLCESYSGMVMVVLCYVPSRICDGHCSISCNWKIFTSTDPLSSMSAL